MEIRIALADDHVMVRDGLKAVIERLSESMKVVAEVSNGEDLVAYALKHDKETDVYVVDISMPVLNGIDATAKLLKINPVAKVVILSMYDDRVSVEKALKAGAQGYIVKVSSSDEIVEAINEVYQGKFYLCQKVSKYVVQGFLDPKKQRRNAHGSGLTSKERAVLQLLAEGHTSKQIAKHFNLSLNTIHVHRNNIMRKIGIHKQAELVRFALKEGIAQL